MVAELTQKALDEIGSELTFCAEAANTCPIAIPHSPDPSLASGFDSPATFS